MGSTLRAAQVAIWVALVVLNVSYSVVAPFVWEDRLVALYAAKIRVWITALPSLLSEPQRLVNADFLPVQYASDRSSHNASDRRCQLGRIVGE